MVNVTTLPCKMLRTWWKCRPQS